jgi:steroid delta-isomerase-like uncharacterized protein
MREKTELNRMITQRIVGQAWNQGDFDGIDALIAKDATFHIRGRTMRTNAQDLERVVAGWHRAFPDFRFSIQDMVAEGDLVAVHLILTGTQQDQWQEIPPIGNRVRVTVMMFLRFQEGQVVEIWEDYDEYGMRKQLGQEL